MRQVEEKPMKPHATARRIKPAEAGIDLDTLVANARGASEFLKALSHEARLMIPASWPTARSR